MTRKLERKEIVQPIHIRDVINGGSFGELVNITAEGLMVITDQPLTPHSIFQLVLDLPGELEGSNTLELGADCLWCRDAVNFNRHWAGFHIIDISEQGLNQIQQLILLYSKEADE
jgi:hypothetical protein